MGMRFVDMAARGLALVFGLILMGGCTTQSGAEVAVPRSAPFVCEIQQRAWCILRGGEIIENRGVVLDSRDSEIRHTLWRIYAIEWETMPALVLEPYGCRQGYSDTEEIIDVRRDFVFQERTWHRVQLRLQKSGKCDLQLLSPLPTEDRAGMAFSILGGRLRSCSASDCAGDRPFAYSLEKVTR